MMKYDAPVFLYGFPLKLKGFYHMPDPNDPERALSTDLLAPEGYGEIVGGGQRVHDAAMMLEQIERFGHNVKDYEWYVDLRRYGTVPHAGFGLGVDRVITWMLGLEHIRDTIPFPRTINRLYP